MEQCLVPYKDGTIVDGTMPYSLNGSPSIATEILTTLAPRLKNGLKFVAQQNQDTCMPHICVVMLQDFRLGRSQLKND